MSTLIFPASAVCELLKSPSSIGAVAQSHRGFVSGLYRGGVRVYYGVSACVVICTWCCLGVHVVLLWCARGGLVVGGVLSCRQSSAVPIKADGGHGGAALDKNEGGDM